MELGFSELAAGYRPPVCSHSPIPETIKMFPCGKLVACFHQSEVVMKYFCDIAIRPLRPLLLKAAAVDFDAGDGELHVEYSVA